MQVYENVKHADKLLKIVSDIFPSTESLDFGNDIDIGTSSNDPNIIQNMFSIAQ